ncbi:MAG: SDR family NAD(P)-dependent oxidoreductase [Gammaproteobacteria bacterium]
MNLSGQVAIVTGAASGIGLATAQRLSAEGAKVVLADLDAAKAQTAAAQLQGEALACACDVGIEAQVEATVQATLARFGRLDIVVHNAGLMVFKPIEELLEADWLRVLRVDLLGAFFFTKQAFLHMPEGGAVVNLASVHAVETEALVAPYAAAKAGLLSLTRSSAIEGRDKKIRVNAVVPGAVDTPMLWTNPNVKSGVEVIDPKDVGRPEDIAAAVAWLASKDAAFVTGAALNVDGGRLARL